VFLNADGLSADCRFKVEILNEQFRPLPGYSADAAGVVSQSGFRQPVSWGGRTTVDTNGQPFRVRVSWVGEDAVDGRLHAVYLE
jgi:hypothetical protein